MKLIYNPAAGRGRTRRHVVEAEACLRRRGARVDLHASTSPADLTRVAADSSRRGYDRVVICGGDGSIHYAIREFDLDSTLGLIPLGSGDDLARVLGIPRSLTHACDVIFDGQTSEIDVATANGTRYVGVAGLGFDSEVAAFANREVRFLRGAAIYLYAILRVLPRFRPHVVRISTERGTRTETIMFAVVGNSRQYGGGIRIVPDARIDDGLLDYCIVHRTSRLQLLKTLPRAYTGSHVRKRFVETGRGREFRFESEEPLQVYADGEFVTTTPVDFALAAGKLKVCVTRSA